MNYPKVFECAICKRLSFGNFKIYRFIGTRKDVRKHLVEEHGIKGVKNKTGLNKKDFGRSEISENTIEYGR